MSLPRTIRNVNVFVDGISYFGRATTAKLPQPKIQTEAHRGAGMDGPVGIDMGMEALSAEIIFAEYDPVLLKKLGRNARFVMRPAAVGEGDLQADTIIATVAGLVTELGTEDLKPGANSQLTLPMDVRYYKLEINGDEILEIDLVNAIRKIGGVDQLGGIRRAMGL